MTTIATAAWRGRDRFTMLMVSRDGRWQTLWRAWRDDPERCARLDLIVITDDLDSLDDRPQMAVTPTGLPRVAWPLKSPGLHRVSLDAGRVQLLLARGALRDWLPELVATVDAFDLDDVMPDGHIAKALARLAAPDATVTVRNADPAMRAALAAAGFALVSTPREALTRAHYAPRFAVKGAPAARAWRSTSTSDRSHPHPHSHPRRALIVGAGLAGCAAAWALAEHGWHSRVIERHLQIAGEASGNPAGLFHGIVNAPDGIHARFNRAAALMAREAVQAAIDDHGAAGDTGGLLRLEATRDVAAMRAMLAQTALPPGYVQALDAGQASERAGIALAHPAWFYPGGGWVAPAALASAFLARAGSFAELSCGIEVQQLCPSPRGWQLRDSEGGLIDEAEVVVLANAGDALRLAGDAAWPLHAVRGQLSWLADAAANHGLALPRLPIAGFGYLLPAIDGAAIFGATSQPGDPEAAVRLGDHAANLAQLRRLIGVGLDVKPDALHGRTAWRWSTPDRLPLIGAVPDAIAAKASGIRLDQARFVPRLAGLHVFSALGARGITWSALGAQVLASGISGAPRAIEASLLSAIDPARFISRAARRPG